jgi:pyridoxal phosphate enzyme (YggS family)
MTDDPAAPDPTAGVGESADDELAARAAELTIRAGESALPGGESTVPAGESTDGESAVRVGESTKADGESAARVGESAPPAGESTPVASESTQSAGESSARRAELAANLAAVRQRIAAACAAADRDPADVLLLAVTKTFPATDVALLSDLGLTYFAENRDGDAAAKVAELRNLRPDREVRWAMVGRLQRNKAKSVSEWADEVQSVDSGRLADALQHAVTLSLDRGKRSEPLDVLIQASIDGDPERGGCPLSDLLALSDHIGGLDALRLRGVMAVAPLGMPPDQAFDRLAVAADHLRTDHPSATCLSSGMSGDLEQAITYGSTCVRVGTALLGGRPLASP